MHNLVTWWGSHPVGREFILFLVATLIAIYPRFSRLAFEAPVVFAGVAGFRKMQRDAAQDLRIMEMIGQDAFRLVAYLAFWCAHSIILCFWFSVIGCVVLDVVPRIWGGHGAGAQLMPFFWGCLFARLIRLKMFVEGLFFPEKTTDRLRKMAAGEKI